MKIDWVEVLLVLIGLFIAYQLLKKILGGSWQTESLIIAMLFFNFTLMWKLNNSSMELNSKFERHIIWHKLKDEKK